MRRCPGAFFSFRSLLARVVLDERHNPRLHEEMEEH